MLPNGHFLIGRKLDMQMAELDPATLQWTAMGSSGKSDFNAEEGWTLMPDGTVLTADVLDNPNSERYIPSLQEWVSMAARWPICRARLGGLYPIWRRSVLSAG